MKYLPGSTLPKKEAQVVGTILNEIANESGMITPEIVVKAAEDESSPLHKYFEWNTKKAAIAYRLEQARHLIREVYVEYKGSRVRAFHNVSVEVSRDDDSESVFETGYMPIARVAESKTLSFQVMEYALTQLRAWREKFGHYQKFHKIAKDIDELE